MDQRATGRSWSRLLLASPPTSLSGWLMSRRRRSRSSSGAIRRAVRVRSGGLDVTNGDFGAVSCVADSAKTGVRSNDSTPHRPRTLLGQRLNDLVEEVLGDVDVIAFCAPATEKVGPGDRRIAESLDGYASAKKIALVTKTDAASRDQITERLMEVDALREDWAAVIPLSAVTADQLGVLADEILKMLPEGPALYPDDVVTDEADDDRIAEIIREAALDGVRDELPHSIAVVVQDVQPRENSDLIDVYADIVVERDSQKAIIIGKKGSRLARVGAAAREQIEPLLGSRVFLSLHVKVAKDWQRDPKQLGRLGF